MAASPLPLQSGAHGDVHAHPTMPHDLVVKAFFNDAVWTAEMHALNELRDCDSVVDVVDDPLASDAEQCDNRLTMCMPRAQGDAFDAFVECTAPFEQRRGEAVRAMRALTRAVAAAHSCGIAHLDVKLENLLHYGPVWEQGAAPQWRLCDFGACRTAPYAGGQARVTRRTVGGTPQFWPPEVTAARGSDPTHPPTPKWSVRGMPWDVWGIGMAAHAALTQHVPWACASWRNKDFVRFAWAVAPEHAEAAGAAAAPGAWVWHARLDADAQSFLLGCLHPCPDKRHTSHALLSHPFLCGNHGTE